MQNRFEIIEKHYMGKIDGIGTYMIIIRDKETGILYLLNKMGGTGAITPLLDQNGDPVFACVCLECGYSLSKDMKTCPECGCPID